MVTKKKKIGILIIHAALAVIFLGYQNCSPGFQSSESASINSVISGQALHDSAGFGYSGFRRLTATEVVRSVNDIFGVNADSLKAMLPSDDNRLIPFSNEFESQPIAPITIENYRDFSESVSSLFVKQANFASKFSQAAGCSPQGVADRDCFVRFATKFGRRVLRRPFTSAEANFYADQFLPIASGEMNFDAAIELAIQAWLQNPAFLYRIESGSVSGRGITALTDFEIATRLSYFIWGSAPDDELLNEAEAGRLKTPDTRTLQALRMLLDNRAKTQWQQFHAEWMGYQFTALPAALEGDMRQETDHLINKIVFENNQDWLDLFRANETYVTPALAQHYGMGSLTAPRWVSYSGNRGGGILAHATFLSKGAKFGDTSPTLRGYEIYKRLMCGKLGQIPAGIDTDNPPGNPTDCKLQRYSMRQNQACATCHNITDNIGFGLENFSVSGQWRTTETNNPNCQINAEGSVGGQSFAGPTELGRLIANNPSTSQCAVTQLFRFFSGRLEEGSDEDVLTALNVEYLKYRSLKSLIVSMVKSPAFVHKVQ